MCSRSAANESLGLMNSINCGINSIFHPSGGHYHFHNKTDGASAVNETMINE